MADPTISKEADAQDTTQTELQNVAKGGTPPLKRIGSAAAALAIVEDLKESSKDWAYARARIQAVYDGHAPFDSAELTRLGRSWACNVNFREMEAIIDMNASSAWAMHMDIGPLVDTKIDSYFLPSDGSGDEWDTIIAEEYSRTLLEWPGFYYLVDMATKDCFKYGVGGATWADENDWRSRPFQIGNLLVPPRAKCDLESLDLFGLRDEMKLGDLFEIVENRDASEKAGWNIGALKKLLVDVYVKKCRPQDEIDDAEQTSTWETFLTKVRTYDPDVAAMQYDGVKVVHLLAREYGGEKGVSHYIIPEGSAGDQSVEFLFEKQNRFASMSNALWLLPHNYGDGAKIRSIKALGHRSLPHCEFSNRFLCQLFDSGILSSSLVVKLQKATSADELQMMRVGPVTVIPPALDPIQTSFTPRMDGLVSLRNLSKDILLNNTGVYRPRSEMPQQSAAFPTAQQVMQEAATGAKFERSQSTFFYIQWQAWHQETFRRMSNSEVIFSSLGLPGQEQAQAFLLRCMRRGVPPEIVLTPGVVKVYSAKALGLGTAEARMGITNQLVAMKPSMGEKGRAWVDRQWAAARIGYWNVEKCFPRDGKESIPGNAASIAALENGSMLDGRMAVVGSDQPHYIHLMAVLSMLQGFAQVVQTQGIQGIANLEDAANAFQLGLPHAVEHLNVLAQDQSRAAQVEQMSGLIKELAAIGQQIVQASEDQIEASAQQAQPAMDPDTMIALAKIEKEKQLGALKMDSLNEQRMQKAGVQAEINTARTRADLALKAARQAQELAIKREESKAKIALEAMKASGQALAAAGTRPGVEAGE